MENLLLSCRGECLSRVPFARMSCVVLFSCFFFFSAKIPEAGTRGAENLQSRMGAIAMRKPDA